MRCHDLLDDDDDALQPAAVESSFRVLMLMMTIIDGDVVCFAVFDTIPAHGLVFCLRLPLVWTGVMVVVAGLVMSLPSAFCLLCTICTWMKIPFPALQSCSRILLGRCHALLLSLCVGDSSFACNVWLFPLCGFLPFCGVMPGIRWRWWRRISYGEILEFPLTHIHVCHTHTCICAHLHKHTHTFWRTGLVFFWCTHTCSPVLLTFGIFAVVAVFFACFRCSHSCIGT